MDKLLGLGMTGKQLALQPTRIRLSSIQYDKIVAEYEKTKRQDLLRVLQNCIIICSESNIKK